MDRVRATSRARPAVGVALIGRALAARAPAAPSGPRRRSPSARTAPPSGCCRRWTTTSLVIESTSDRPVWVSTSVTSESQREDSPGVSSGTGTISSRRFLMRGHPAQHRRRTAAPRGRRSRTPRRAASSWSEHADEVADHVVDRDRLGPGAHPAGRDHRRQVVDQLPGHLPGDAAGADDDAGAQHGHRHAGRAEQALDLAPAAQVRGERLVVAAEAAEVDDLLHPGRGGGRTEGARGLGVERARSPWSPASARGSRPRGSRRAARRACRRRGRRRGPARPRPRSRRGAGSSPGRRGRPRRARGTAVARRSRRRRRPGRVRW